MILPAPYVLNKTVLRNELRNYLCLGWQTIFEWQWIRICYHSVYLSPSSHLLLKNTNY